MVENILFKGYTGSYLYGLNTEESDVDIMYIYVPDREELYGLKKQETTRKGYEEKRKGKNTSEAIDITVKSISSFINGLIQNDVNYVDLIFANNENKIINNLYPLEAIKDKILSQRYVNNAIAMAMNSFKAINLDYHKLEYLKKFEDRLNLLFTKGRQFYSITVEQALHNGLFEKEVAIYDKCKVDYTIEFDDKLKIDFNDGMISSHNETLKVVRNKLRERIKSLESIQKSIEEVGYPSKRIAVGLRYLYILKSIRENGTYKLPFNEEIRNTILSVKKGEMHIDEVIKLINTLKEEIRIDDEFNLREEPDKDVINKIACCFIDCSLSMTSKYDIIEDALKDVKYLRSIINSNGFDCNMVGGFVRDKVISLDGLYLKNDFDIDLNTNANYEQLSAILNAEGIETDSRGKHFNVIIAKIDGKEYEIAGYRKDLYEVNENDEVKMVGVLNEATLEDDLNRRDFTINAFTMSDSSKYVSKFVSNIAISDMVEGVLRTVGNPDDRFKEDPIRILRAIRFAYSLDLHIEMDTLESIKNNISLLKEIPKERIVLELNKLLKYKLIKSFKYLYLVDAIMTTAFKGFEVSLDSKNLLNSSYENPRDLLLRYKIKDFTELSKLDKNLSRELELYNTFMYSDNIDSLEFYKALKRIDKIQSKSNYYFYIIKSNFISKFGESNLNNYLVMEALLKGRIRMDINAIRLEFGEDSIKNGKVQELELDLILKPIDLKPIRFTVDTEATLNIVNDIID